MPSWMISSLFELGKLLKAWKSSHGMPSGKDRDDVINKQLKTQHIFQTLLSRIVTLLSNSLSSTLQSMLGHRNLQRPYILHKDCVSKKMPLIELYRNCPEAVSS
jgi:hypothetical protein